MPEKPKFGAPCSQCGLCCQLEQCEVADAAFGPRPGPCIALVERQGRHLCGFVLVEQITKLAPIIQHGLGIGTGCSMPDATTTQEELDTFDLLSKIKVQTLHPIPA